MTRTAQTPAYIFDKDGVFVDARGEIARIKAYWPTISRLRTNQTNMLEDDYCSYHLEHLTGAPRDTVVHTLVREFGLEMALKQERAALKQQWESGRFGAPQYAEMQEVVERGLKVHQEITSFPSELVLTILRLASYLDLPLPERCPAAPGVLAFLRSLAEQHVPLALITENYWVRTQEELEYLGIPDVFEIGACKDKVFYRDGHLADSPGDKKQMYQLLQQHFHPRWCIAVEDSSSGANAAREAGLPVLWIPEDLPLQTMLQADSQKGVPEMVEIAEVPGKDYETYQVKNNPTTFDYAVTVVSGAPFPPLFRRTLSRLCDGLVSIFASFPNVLLWVYRDWHWHATICPAVRTPFDADRYLINPEEVNRKQQETVASNGLCYEQIEKAVHPTRPFEVQLSWQIKIKDRGEILLLGKASTAESCEELVGLRKRLIGEGLQKWDAGANMHICLGAIKDFHRLSSHQKNKAKELISDLLTETQADDAHTDRVYIDRVQLVYYTHRSLSRVVSSREILFQWH